MELPSVVIVGEEVIDDIGYLMRSKGIGKKGIVAAGERVWATYGDLLGSSLAREEFWMKWVPVKDSTLNSVKKVEAEARNADASFIIGFGGGKSIDVAKLAAFNIRVPLISVPTSAAHDGIASPFASIKNVDRPYSFTTKPPLIVVADVRLILKAPLRLISSGVGDLVAKLTAVKDWELSRDERGEYFGEYSAKLAMLSAEHVMSNAELIGQKEHIGLRGLIEALISAGVAAGIAGSSRPCSGSEHLFCHALDIIAPEKGLHGEKTGLGTIMMAKLHGLDWRRVRNTLEKSKAPTSAYQIGLNKEEVVKALLLAPKIRPERYTILHKIKLDEKGAYELASSAEVV
jgi:glycerol-1-phosphate dehydrogenase [NAD(P)+]